MQLLLDSGYETVLDFPVFTLFVVDFLLGVNQLFLLVTLEQTWNVTTRE